MGKLMDIIAKITGREEVDYPIYRKGALNFDNMHYVIDFSASSHYFELPAVRRSINTNKI